MHLQGAVIAFATRAEGHDQARDEDRTGAWQRREQRAVRVRRDEFGDPPFEGGDGAAESRQQCHQRAGCHGSSFPHRRVVGSWHRGIDRSDALLDAFRRAAVVVCQELVPSAGVRPLELVQTRPALQQSPDQGASDIIKPTPNLRKIEFQTIGQTIALSGLLIDGAPAFLYQEMQ
jgi:hypothetical protein